MLGNADDNPVQRLERLGLEMSECIVTALNIWRRGLGKEDHPGIAAESSAIALIACELFRATRKRENGCSWPEHLQDD